MTVVEARGSNVMALRLGLHQAGGKLSNRDPKRSTYTSKSSKNMHCKWYICTRRNALLLTVMLLISNATTNHNLLTEIEIIAAKGCVKRKGTKSGSRGRHWEQLQTLRSIKQHIINMNIQLLKKVPDSLHKKMANRSIKAGARDWETRACMTINNLTLIWSYSIKKFIIDSDVGIINVTLQITCHNTDADYMS